MTNPKLIDLGRLTKYDEKIKAYIQDGLDQTETSLAPYLFDSFHFADSLPCKVSAYEDIPILLIEKDAIIENGVFFYFAPLEHDVWHLALETDGDPICLSNFIADQNGCGDDDDDDLGICTFNEEYPKPLWLQIQFFKNSTSLPNGAVTIRSDKFFRGIIFKADGTVELNQYIYSGFAVCPDAEIDALFASSGDDFE